MRCTVLGAGSWGTALASQLARVGHETVLWDRHPDRCDHLNTHHRNPRYLTDLDLPESLRAEPELAIALRGCELLVPVVPSHALRGVMSQVAALQTTPLPICCATKGIEQGTLMTMAEVLTQVVPWSQGQVAMLYGPSFAAEVTKGLPTAVVAAGPDYPAHVAADAFHGEAFRAYHTEDTVGVCVGGSLKNVIAIACGVSDGVGLGLNARAALITRGLAEISRLAVDMGANPLTMAGLAGMGDLVLTCTGNLSRNRRVGLALGEGRTLADILEELGEVAEGVTTAESAHELATQRGIEMPITSQIHAMLYQDKPVRQAMMELLSRGRRAERD